MSFSAVQACSARESACSISRRKLLIDCESGYRAPTLSNCVIAPRKVRRAMT
jgi:hypothetical protein